MFMTYERSPNMFDKDSEGNVFPNIEKIKKYFSDISAEDNKIRKITMISTGPTFNAYWAAELTWLNYDNGQNVGTETVLQWDTTKDKGIICIVGWKMTISHTQEMNKQQIDNLISKGADIMTMSSLKRNGNINLNGSLRRHPYGHSLVQFNDGTRWEVILNQCTSEEKQKVINSLSLDISRAVYADSDAKTNYLDWIWISTSKGDLEYSHPDRWDLFINDKTTPGKVIKDNMPGIIIQYTIENKIAH